MFTSLAVAKFVIAGCMGLAGDPGLRIDFKKDPVALVGGQELDGVDSITVEQFRFRYWFANESNKAAFLAHPEKYEVQLGGACARMGPLSGWGSPEIRAVHDGRIFLFASPRCRETFLANPAAFLDPDDPPAGGDSVALRKGRALLMKAVEGMGGADKVDSATGYEQRFKRIEEYNEGEPHEVIEGVSIAFPDKVRSDFSWDGSKYSYMAAEDTGWALAPNDPPQLLHPQQIRALRRQHYWRTPLAILKARNEPGFIAASQGATLVPDGGLQVSVEKVAVSFQGTTSILGLQASSGRILFMSYRGQGPNSTYGTVEKRFSNFEDIGGLILPTSVETYFEGQLVPKATVKNLEIRINSPYPADQFGEVR